MGDMVGDPVEGKLSFVPLAECVRILESGLDKTVLTTVFANIARINALYMIACAGSGHIGSSFSCLDIVSWLHLAEMKDEDIFFSSKGHDAPAYYSVMAGLGKLDFDFIHTLRRKGGLPGHPDISLPICKTNTGSLGMGISKAKGMLYANNHFGRSGNVYVLTGDGELQEGQIWESLISAAHQKLDNLIVIVDHNKLQSDTYVEKTSDLGELEQKFAAFGWYVGRCDGHDPVTLKAVFEEFSKIKDRPKVLIADTVKGRGVSFMEHTSLDSDVAMYRFHSGAPDKDSYIRAVDELQAAVDGLLEPLGISSVTFESVNYPQMPEPPRRVERLVSAYSQAFVKEADKNDRIIALDADLILDTGLIPFKEKFPDRFVECGIAEQDMVSQAGGMALSGLLPVVHSFSCFLSARPNEQIYNNATENTRIVYVGSLAGLLPGGPGHSHQAVRDIAALSAVPGLEMIEPCCEEEVAMALNYCLNTAKGSTYLRLTSIPCEIPYALSKQYHFEAGKGTILRDGQKIAIIAYGPVLLAEAWNAAEILQSEGVNVRIINLPWLNRIDIEWVNEAITGCETLLTLDNHFLKGGQGMLLSALLSGNVGEQVQVKNLGVSGVPECGTNAEVLHAHGLDSNSLAKVIRNLQSS